MSRTLLEWLEARDEWRTAQGYRINSLPMPGRDSVVYERESTNEFWHKRWDHAKGLIPGSSKLSFTEQQIVDFIDAAADIEATKEEEFLNKFFPDRTDTNTIEQFNILFQSKDQLEKINNRLKDVFEKRSRANMAPNLSALLGSYLETELNHILQANLGSVNANMTPDEILSIFNNQFEQAVLKASERLTEISDDKGFGTGEEWKPVHDALTAADPRARNLFIDALKQAIGIGQDRVYAIFENIWTQQQAKAEGKRKRITYRSILAKHLKIAKQTAQIGGTVAEQALAAIANSVNNISGGNNSLRYNMQAEGVLGNMVKTDSFMLFSSEVTMDVAGAAEELNEMLSDSDGLNDAYNIFNNFYEKYKKDMDELYSVFVNAKNYTMGSSYHDYKDVKSGPLEELPTFLSRAGIEVGAAEDFLAFAYNTGEGAIRHGARHQLEENVINALKAAAAKIMFDDYQTYGQGSGHSIHMYYLSGKYIPSSYVFRGMANAAKNMRAKTEAQVHLPDKVDDRGPHWGFIGSDADYKEQLFNHWRTEYENAKAASNWSVSFTLYMKNILQSSVM